MWRVGSWFSFRGRREKEFGGEEKDESGESWIRVSIEEEEKEMFRFFEPGLYLG